MNSESRFANLDIDAAPRAGSPAPACVPVAPALNEGNATHGDIDGEGRARAITSDRAAKAHGLAFAEPTIYRWGTRVMSGAGEARAELHAMPLLSELRDKAASIVIDEQRTAHVAPMTSILYGVDDRVRTRTNSPGVPCSAQALKQLLARADAPGGAYLTDPRLRAAHRALHVKFWLDRFNTMEAEAIAEHKRSNPRGKAPKAANVKLLSKLQPRGERALYGVVGEKYPLYGMDAVIADVIRDFPSEARGVLAYDASTTKWRVDAAIGAEFEPVVGDVFRVGVKFGAHDAGGGAYWADLYAIRVRCINFSRISTGRRLGRVRHVGSVEALRERVKSLIGVGAEAMQTFSGLWREANEAAIVEGSLVGEGDARDVFRALIKGGYVDAPDGCEVAVERYFNAWLKEPGHRRSDFVNAITRAAHEAPWSSPWAGDALEEQAGQLLYNHVVLTPSAIEAVQA